MASIFAKGSLRWILFFMVGLSVISFLLFGLHLVTKQSIIEHHHRGVPYLVKHGRILTDDIPSKQAEIQRVNEALRNTELEAKKLYNTKSNPIPNSVDKVTPLLEERLNFTMKNVSLNFNVHIFYYPWYKNEQIDGKYTHWNHEVIPDWQKKSSQHLTRRRQYVPPDDIGANFYPKLGPYSSHDPKVIDAHMKQMRSMGTGVVCVSWYPPQFQKSSETPVDDMMMALFDGAAKYGLKVTFHIEPYANRSGETLREVSKFIINKYGNHSSFYRTNINGRKLPVYYVYDSYQIAETSWAEALHPNGRYSVRNTKYDAVFLGLVVDRAHISHLSSSGFDGFYTYFATNGFSYGSSWFNWPAIATKSKQEKLIFVPSIGPGYLDTRVRPWNRRNTRLRLNGKYYRKSFHNAMAEKPHFLSITSFNEWHEGTQVEPAIPKVHDGFKYVDYNPSPPEFYLNLTGQFVVEYTKNMSTFLHQHERDAF